MNQNDKSKKTKEKLQKVIEEYTKTKFKQAKFKQDLAEPNAILIDDREDNIERWIEAGGIGIRHTSTASTIKQLKQLGL